MPEEVKYPVFGKHFCVATKNLIYVVCEEDEFNALAVPAVEYEKLFVKTGTWNGIEVVFQFWKEPSDAQITRVG